MKQLDMTEETTETFIVGGEHKGDNNIYSIEWVKDYLVYRNNWEKAKIAKTDKGTTCISFVNGKATDECGTPWLDDGKLYVLFTSGFIYENKGTFDDPVVDENATRASDLIFTEELGFNNLVWLTSTDGNVFIAAD